MCPVTVRDGARVPRKALDARTPYPPPEATFRIPAEGEKKKSPPVPFLSGAGGAAPHRKESRRYVFDQREPNQPR